LLIRDVAAAVGSRVKVVTEEYGNSPMAERFGVRRYPVVFVDDVLMARPKDFGFAGPDDKSAGRYVPWREPASQEKFKADLRRMVDRRLKGERVEGFSAAEARDSSADEDGPPTLPAVEATTVEGTRVNVAGAAGKVVLVEIWATWCPPCRTTLAWLDQLQRAHPDTVSVVAIAIDSPEADVRKLVADLKPAYQVVMGTADVIAPFGAVAAVPKLFVFDRSGARAGVFYGAPPDQHAQVQALLDRVAKR
jgi:cytochrome c biogenesis protein CcmG/thiol:disulfide interchange protein DsbE